MMPVYLFSHFKAINTESILVNQNIDSILGFARLPKTRICLINLKNELLVVFNFLKVHLEFKSSRLAIGIVEESCANLILFV